MADLERTQIYLTRAELPVLDRIKEDTGVSQSELVRRAIDRVYLGVDTRSREDGWRSSTRPQGRGRGARRRVRSTSNGSGRDASGGFTSAADDGRRRYLFSHRRAPKP